MTIKNELFENSKKCTSVQELMVLAKENGMEMTEKQAEVVFANISKSSEVADNELDAVVGGNVANYMQGDPEFKSDYSCPICGSKNLFIWPISRTGLAICECMSCDTESRINLW